MALQSERIVLRQVQAESVLTKIPRQTRAKLGINSVDYTYQVARRREVKEFELLHLALKGPLKLSGAADILTRSRELTIASPGVNDFFN
jgi:hypothetical protein